MRRKILAILVAPLLSTCAQKSLPVQTDPTDNINSLAGCYELSLAPALPLAVPALVKLSREYETQLARDRGTPPSSDRLAVQSTDGGPLRIRYAYWRALATNRAYLQFSTLFSSIGMDVTRIEKQLHGKANYQSDGIRIGERWPESHATLSPVACNS